MNTPIIILKSLIHTGCLCGYRPFKNKIEKQRKENWKTECCYGENHRIPFRDEGQFSGSKVLKVFHCGKKGKVHKTQLRCFRE